MANTTVIDRNSTIAIESAPPHTGRWLTSDPETWIKADSLRADIQRPTELERKHMLSQLLLAAALLAAFVRCSDPSAASVALVDGLGAEQSSLAPLHAGRALAVHRAGPMQQPFSLEAASDQATKSEPLSDQNAPPPAPPPRRRLRLGTLNIRYDFHSRHPLQAAVLQPALSLIQGRTWGEHRWQERRDALVDQVLFHDLDLVGFQEVLHHQLEDLVHLMDPSEYGHVGVGRDDGKHAGEAVPIFYRRSVPVHSPQAR